MSHDDHKLAEMYDKLAQKTKELYAESSEKTVAALEHAIEKSRESFEKAGDITRLEGEKVKAYLRRDLEQTAEHVSKLSDQTKDQVEPAVRKVETGFLNLTYHLAHSASDVLARLADWADSSASYKTGQVTCEGILRCKHCNKEMHFKKTGSIPPCPGCRKTEFKKIA